jgi:Holliday junction DNA helicase RuvA
MIAFLEGKIAEALPTRVVLDVNGVGYEILIPLSTFDKLPLSADKVKILTHLQVREDAHVLFGFYSTEERDLFKLLINHVSGVGPKMALNVLSSCSVSDFKQAVVSNDISGLSKFKGVGKKTAERIVVELKDKVGVSEVWGAAASAKLSPEQKNLNDAMLTLIALGYKQADALKAIQTLDPKLPTEELVRDALKKL